MARNYLLARQTLRFYTFHIVNLPFVFSFCLVISTVLSVAYFFIFFNSFVHFY